MLAKYPPAVDDMGDTSNGTIQGSCWYAVVIITLNPKCYLAQDLKINAVAICFEQFARKHNKMFVAWPFDHLDAKASDASGSLGGASGAVAHTHAPWRLLAADEEDLLTLGKGYNASDFGDDGNLEDGSSPASEPPAW